MTLPHLLSDLLTIILLDLVLAGDNAIVIALAARKLPRTLQKRAVIWGTLGAIGVRIVLTVMVVYLLGLPGLMLAGGLLLLPIAWKLLKPGSDGHGHGVAPAAGFWPALRTIVAADVLMGLDNVLAIAGAAKGHMGLVVIGLLISIPLVAWGSTLILRLIESLPIIIYAGAAAIAWTAGRMISHEPLWRAWIDTHGWVKHALEIGLTLIICIGGYLRNRRPA
ncbi:YjbE family putative metal transport protein [Dyella choica]|uniref:TerC family protein n=1 Tax=Dyella choica TaxID=1927959 RepID=A0A3S0RHG4_9GAMM|nr:YjbE family putative metal transport protein [Dyella choica]RUL69533.1 TerC family protein [Dyella choica]